MFKFDPSMEDDASSPAHLFAEGEYDFIVKRATAKRSKSGNEMIEVILTVTDGKNEIDVFDWLLEAMKYKLKHFCEATGFQKQYEKGELEETDLEGAQGKVKLIIEDSEQYGTQNKVEDYVPKTAEKSEENEENLDDTIPF